MLPLEHPDRIQIAFDDHRLVNNAGLLLPATLAQHVGQSELVDRHLDLGDAPWPPEPATCCSATASRTLVSSFSKPSSGQISRGVPGSRKARTNSP